MSSSSSRRGPGGFFAGALGGRRPGSPGGRRPAGPVCPEQQRPRRRSLELCKEEAQEDVAQEAQSRSAQSDDVNHDPYLEDSSPEHSAAVKEEVKEEDDEAAEEEDDEEDDEAAEEHWHVFSLVKQEVAEFGIGEVGELVELPFDDYEVFTKVLAVAPAEAVVPDSECESGDEDYEAAPADDEELAPGVVGREVHDSMAFVKA